MSASKGTDELEQDGPEITEFQYRHATQVHDRIFDFHYRLMEGAIASGEIALKAIFAINGGSAVALLAFIAQLAASGSSLHLATLFDALELFSYGVGAATISACFSYLSYYSTGNSNASRSLVWKRPYQDDTLRSRRWSRVAGLMTLLCFAAAFVSVALFFAGIFVVSSAALI